MPQSDTPNQAAVSTSGDAASSSGTGAPGPISLASSPHLAQEDFTTRRMMIDVLIGLSPVVVAAVAVFRWDAVVQVGLCILSCVVADVLLAWMRGKPMPVGDCSAVVTGAILGFSLPWSAPWYIAVIGSAAAIGLGKAVFGGLGFNIFNPAMVGRAFVMLSFAREMGASAYVAAQAKLPILTQATPLSVAKKFTADLAAGKDVTGMQGQMDSAGDLGALLLGSTNGSLGETSVVAILIGGAYLCVRKVIAWEIPVAMLSSVFVFVQLGYWAGLTEFMGVHHVASGALLFGALFIATDPVTSPVSRNGKLLFGAGIGVLVVVIRLFSGYPEGVMFAVLLMNAGVPLLDRWTIPRPLGGPPPAT